MLEIEAAGTRDSKPGLKLQFTKIPQEHLFYESGIGLILKLMKHYKKKK